MIPVPRKLLPALLALAGMAVRLDAQQNAAGGSRSTLEGVFTAAQAVRGEARFKATCANCHSVKQFTTPGMFRPWNGRPVRDVFEMVRTLMPDDNPGSLDRQTYADVLAYLLRANGYPAGKAELPADDAALRRIRVAVKPGPAEQ